MRAAAPAALVLASGFAAAQSVVEYTSTVLVVVPETTETVWVSSEVEPSVVETSTSTVLADEETVTVTESEGVETSYVAVVPEESTEVETITAIPTETTSWIRYWPDLESSTTITTTFYRNVNPNNGTDYEPPAEAAADRKVGSSLAALVAFGVAGLYLL